VQRRVQTYLESRQTPDFGTFALDERGERVIPILSASIQPDDKSEPSPTPIPSLLIPPPNQVVSIASVLDSTEPAGPQAIWHRKQRLTPGVATSASPTWGIRLRSKSC
jgi:hypothetical protein